jgi:hypothetical protein
VPSLDRKYLRLSKRYDGFQPGDFQNSHLKKNMSKKFSVLATRFATQFMLLCCGASLLSLLPIPWQIPWETGLRTARSLLEPFSDLAIPSPFDPTPIYVVTETPGTEAEAQHSSHNEIQTLLRSFYSLELSWTKVWVNQWQTQWQTQWFDQSDREAIPVDPLAVLDRNRAVLAQRPELIVDLSDRRLYVYNGRTLKKSYPIAIGQAGWETPLGVFQVMDKQKSPAWKHPLTGKIVTPGEDNPLGMAWIGFWFNDRYQIGFHGTAIESDLGEAISHGCVRLRNADILELYAQVEQGWVVTVRR